MLKIKRINEKSDVYDITVKDNNNFYANNILVHNCLEVNHPLIPISDVNDPNGEIGVCILAAVNWLEIASEQEMESVCDIIVRMLDSLIEHQDYFVPAAENFAKKRRSLGVGVSNLAALLAKEGLKYWDTKAPNFVAKWMEMMSFYLIKASVEMAKELGKCEKFDRTKFSQGILPIDTYKRDVDEFITEPLHMDWEGLRSDIKQHGMRHSTLTACMPVESCLSWDTSVVTIDGKKTFHEICEYGGIDWKSIEDNNSIGWYSLKYPISVKTLEGIKRVDKIYYNGKKSTFNIELENGIVVKCTANHKFLVKVENGAVWKHAYELEEYDDIVEI